MGLADLLEDNGLLLSIYGGRTGLTLDRRPENDPEAVVLVVVPVQKRHHPLAFFVLSGQLTTAVFRLVFIRSTTGFRAGFV